MMEKEHLVPSLLKVGVGFADMSGRRLGACQFADDDRLCSLEAVIVQLGARECVLLQEAAPAVSETTLAESQPSSDRIKMEEVLSRCGIKATVRPKAFFSTKHVEADLAKLVKVLNHDRRYHAPCPSLSIRQI
jgi:DNA mismatch repair protein MSH2